MPGSLIKSILNPNRPTLVDQFLLRFVPLSLLVVLFAGGYYYLRKGDQESFLKNEQSLNVEFMVSTIQSKLVHFVHDLRILAGHKELGNYLNTLDSESKQALEEEYLVYLNNSDYIDQIRLLDFSGNEKIRVNFEAGNPQVVKSDDLQSKAGRYYFQNVKQLPSDHIYVSPLDLNIENGELEYPLKPMLRLATVVSSEDNNYQNILIINFLGDVLLQVDFRGANVEGEQLLVNSNGSYLKGFDPDEEWGFMLKERKHFSFGAKYPEFWAAILGSDSDQILTAQGLMTYKKIYFPADSNMTSTVTFEDPNYHWALISLFPPDKLLALYSLNDVLMVSFGSLLALAFICYQISKGRIDETRLKQQLQRSENQYRSLVDNSSEIIWRINPEGTLTYISPAVKDVSGFEPDELLGIHIRDMFADKGSATSALESLNQVLQGDLGSEPIVHELRHPRKEGGSYLAEIRSVPILDEDGVLVEIQGVTRDITDRKQMENELLKMEKLESIGILAGGIAHDLNNFLTAIMGNLSLARMSDDRRERETFLDNTDSALAQLQGLTQQLLTFAKGGTPILDTRDIRTLLEDGINFSLRGSTVAYELTLPDDLSLVNIDVGQINQVISNLIINARQAMQTGGTVRISANNFDIEKESQIPLAAGAYIKVSIEDEGTGIEEDDLPRIFDPFFTTKESGSGLGLATSFAIIQKHGGHISVESQLGKGTKFEIYLPVSKQSQVSQEQDQQIIPVRGEGRILLMDDSEDIRILAQQMLNKLGYDASVARNGEEAIELYEMAMKSNEPYRAVILDLTIPGAMGGRQTIEKLKRIDPQVMAIVSSGYSTDPVVSNYQDYGFSGVLIKPYVTGAMSTVLQDILSINQRGHM